MIIPEMIAVIDCGTSCCRSGIAGTDEPGLIFPSTASFDCSRDTNTKRAITSNGKRIDWDIMQNIWEYSFTNLECAPSETSILVTEPLFNSRPNREKISEILFETLNSSAMMLKCSSALPLFATGAQSGLVLECGAGISSSVPIFEGYADLNYSYRLSIGGSDITDFLIQNLNSSRTPRPYVDDMKERICRISSDFTMECFQYSCAESTTTEYQFPDGNIVKLRNETFACPEVLFRPEIYSPKQETLALESFQKLESAQGIQDMVHRSISGVDKEIQLLVSSNIILAGGSTMFQGFGKRLKKDLWIRGPTNLVKIVAPANRSISTWIGGSILASLSTLRPMFISKEEYQESGPSIVQRKSF